MPLPSPRRHARDAAMLALPLGLLALALLAALHAAFEARAGAEDMGKWRSVTPIPATASDTAER